MSTAVSELKGVTKQFVVGKQTILAVQDVTFNISRNEFLAIVGPSGCGKSTLLKIVAGLLRPTSGEVFVKEKPVNGPVNGVGMVFQKPVLLPWLNVLSNVMLPSEIMKLDKNECLKRAKQLIELVGLREFEKRQPFELSGGMQQRVALLRALLTDPEFLLMDEPFAALDAITRERMASELLSLLRKSPKTVLFITHSIPEAVFLADRVIVMTPRPGRVQSVINIDLPRPRSIPIMGSPEFGRYTTEIRAEIEREAFT